MSDTGTVTKMEFGEADDGRQVVRFTVEFYDGAVPGFTVDTIWKQKPVRIVLADETTEP